MVGSPISASKVFPRRPSLVFLHLVALTSLVYAQVFQNANIPLSKGLLKPPTTIEISSDTVVSGIDVYNDSFKQVLERLGKPSRTETSPPRSEWGRTFVTVTYEWEGSATWLKLTTLQQENEEPRITRVEVWGSRPDGEIGTTGRGLKLGETIADARRVYGLRLRFGVTLSEKGRPCRLGNYIEFSPTLSLEFNDEQRVNHMTFPSYNLCPS